MYVVEPEPQASGRLGWFVDKKIGPLTTPTGHETLTDMAAHGLVTNQADLKALVDGARRPDEADPNDHIKLGEQKRHFLRTSQQQTSLAAWIESIRHLRTLHQQILASSGAAQFGLIGEAMHLIQDSYAPAHAERDPGTREITFIRYYGPSPLPFPFIPSKPYPDAHTSYLDPRDNIFDKGSLKPEAQEGVQASREYLNLVLGHVGASPPAPQIHQDLNAFIARRLRFQMPVLRPGSRGEAVRLLQQSLNVWLKQAGLAPLAVTGAFKRLTEQAVRRFQRSIPIQANGVVGRQTWGLLPLP